MEHKFYKLQNGSDIRGVALEGIENEKVNLTENLVYYIGAAFSNYLEKKLNSKKDTLKIAVGHDSRLSAPFLKEAIIKGINAQDSLALDCGLASTPSIFMATILEEVNCDGGIMITASHLPFNRNGMKFFTKDGGLESKDIKDILQIAIQLEKDKLPNKALKVEKTDLMKYYSANLRKIICEELNDTNFPLKDMHIVVDAGNGAGGFFVEQVLKPLGANTEGSIYLDPDGRFPNHIPNPENEKAMQCIKEATLNNKADLGIIFDTDVDRSAIVFKNGKEVNKNALIALMSVILSRKYPGSTIVTDSITSDYLHTFLEDKLGLRHHRFKRGYRNVINESIRLNKEGTESCLAIETSGHGALKKIIS